MSRAELSRKLGLSKSTCSLLVDELLSKKLVTELGKDKSSGGRKPTLVDLNYYAGVAVGLKIMIDRISGVLIDLSGKVTCSDEIHISPHSRVDEYYEKTLEIINRLIHNNDKIADREIYGVGISMGGRINYDAGVLIESSILHWHNEAFARNIEAKIGLPVFLENDVNTFAWGENHFGHGKNYSNYVCISIGQGIGAGIIINNQIYKGSHHGAGEFGHMKIAHQKDLRRCSCGEYGCLEAYASTPALLKEATLKYGERVNMEALLKKASEKDGRALEIFQNAAQYLGLGIANLVNIFDPEVVLIGGEGTAYTEYITDEVQRVLSENIVYDLANEIPVVFLPYEADMWSRGTAAMVLMEHLQIAFE